MNKVRVKICGIMTVEEALSCIRAGADAVGIIMGIRYLAEDAVDAVSARKILSRVPPFVSSVLVTHLVSSTEIMELYKKVGTTAIQIQDAISPDELKSLRKNIPHVRIIKSVHVVDRGAIDEAKFWAPLADGILLDSRTPEKIGGTGLVHDWNISRDIVGIIKKPVILAGGLTPENVIEAIDKVKPFAVDVNSGVEFRDGRKDPKRVADFINRAKSWR